MQRIKKKKVDQTVNIDQPVKTNQIRWVNHGGPFYMKDGSVIKTGMTFTASPEDVPKSFRDVIKPLDPIAAAPVVEPVMASSFSLRQRESTSFFDILDSSGKRVNEKDLTEDQAKEILDKFVI